MIEIKDLTVEASDATLRNAQGGWSLLGSAMPRAGIAPRTRLLPSVQSPAFVRPPRPAMPLLHLDR